MKTRFLATAVMVAAGLLAVVPAQAQYIGPTQSTAVSVADILANPVDDMQVQLKGRIVRQLSEKKYIFSDTTGEIVAEIKPKRWLGLQVDETTEVELFGEVDTSRYRAPEIEVDLLRLAP